VTTRIAFVMEQHLGHETYAANLRSMVTGRSDVVTDWIPVSYERSGEWWERIPSSAVTGALRGRREVRRGLDGVPRPDVCVYNTQVPAVIGGRRARAQPYVLCTDVTPVQYDAMAAGYAHAADRPGPLRWAKHAWNRRVFARAAAHAPWSTWVRDSLIADYGVAPERIEVIPPGVDTATWAVADPGGGPMRILFVGGDFSRKGGDLLLQAVAALDDSELRAVTRSDIGRQPRVEAVHGLTPNDPALRELFRTSDVFVLPSRAETFGIAAVEAAAAALPVVVTNVGGLADLVIDGTTGFAIEPDDGDGLIAALRRLEADPELRRSMGRAARHRAEREFDARTNADRLVDVALAAVSS
jgi:glycosyltransferase involved in cell wall biosynthesis